MKKTWLLVFALSLSVFALAWCNNKCECDNAVNEPTVTNEPTANEDAVLNERIAYCNEHWGTHSLIHSPTAAYWECAFPSGVICDDTTLWTDDCSFEPNTQDIDTEEKRLAGCEENVQWRDGDYSVKAYETWLEFYFYACWPFIILFLLIRPQWKSFI
jgi:putative hemolysin